MDPFNDAPQRFMVVGYVRADESLNIKGGCHQVTQGQQRFCIGFRVSKPTCSVTQDIMHAAHYRDLVDVLDDKHV